jgi:hypothetical protein
MHILPRNVVLSDVGDDHQDGGQSATSIGAALLEAKAIFTILKRGGDRITNRQSWLETNLSVAVDRPRSDVRLTVE